MLLSNIQQLFQIKFLNQEYFLLQGLAHLDNDKLQQYCLKLVEVLDFDQELDNNTQVLLYAPHYLYELNQYFKKYSYGHTDPLLNA